jgi:hypothetical protein
MHQPAKHSDVTGPADRPGLLAPDTSGMHYRADIMSRAPWRGPGRAIASTRCAASAVVPGDRSPGTGERPFRLTENSAQRAITNHLLGERAVGMAEVGELLSAA